MRRRRAARAVLCALLLAGCGGAKISGQSIGARAADYSPTERIRVMLPVPSNPGGEGAGRIVAARVVEVLQQTHADVALLATSDDAQALADARHAKAAFLITPVILDWTDNHAPPFNADHVKVRLDLREPGTGETVSAVTFENTSSLAAVIDTRPEALLDESFNRAVTMLVTTGTPGQGTVRQPGPDTLEHVPVDEQKYPRQ
jgi:hypothetical protein